MPDGEADGELDMPNVRHCLQTFASAMTEEQRAYSDSIVNGRFLKTVEVSPDPAYADLIKRMAREMRADFDRSGRR